MIADESVDGEAVAETSVVLVQCTKCLKWRRGESGKHDIEKFICSDLPGFSCRTAVEDPAHRGIDEDPTAEKTPEESASSSSKAKAAQRRNTRGWGRGKQTRVCPTCGQRRERSAVGKERHYRMSPSCRPAEETTPQIIAGLVLDLSDRLPYLAVLRKDMRMWENFTSRTKACTTFDQAAKELLWLFKQLRPIVLDQSWDESTAQAFRDECQTCKDAHEALKLLQRMELEAIDWPKVFQLWETERGEAAGAAEASKGKRQRSESRAETKAKRKKPVEVPHEGGIQPSVEAWPAAMRGGTVEVEEEEVEVEDEDDEEEVEEEVAEAEVEEEMEQEAEAGAGRGEEEEQYTVGTLVEVLLDDDEQALAIVSQTPDSDNEQRYQVTFLDDKQQIALDDTLWLELPNEFVKVLLPCEPIPGLRKGWIPVPVGEDKRFVGPQGQVCKSVEEIARIVNGRNGPETDVEKQNS